MLHSLWAWMKRRNLNRISLQLMMRRPLWMGVHQTTTEPNGTSECFPREHEIVISQCSTMSRSKSTYTRTLDWMINRNVWTGSVATPVFVLFSAHDSICGRSKKNNKSNENQCDNMIKSMHSQWNKLSTTGNIRSFVHLAHSRIGVALQGTFCLC